MAKFMFFLAFSIACTVLVILHLLTTAVLIRFSKHDRINSFTLVPFYIMITFELAKTIEHSLILQKQNGHQHSGTTLNAYWDLTVTFMGLSVIAL